MKTGPDVVTLIQSFEGCAKRRPDGLIEAYPDPGTGGEPWTIGWGTTRYANGQKVQPGDTVTQEEADALLLNDLEGAERQVTRAIGDAPTTQKQFDALVSFHYNTRALLSSTLLARHKAGRYAEATNEFLKWVHAGDHILPGLVRRRAAEAALYSAGTPS
jgi:GH24 family phage-related lysozyme (muramidase)